MNNTTHAGEIALVTGGNKGIGRQIVRRLAAEGLTVYLGSRDKARGEAAASELAGPAADVRLIQLDVTDASQVEAAVARIDTEHGRLDVLVNNAGVIEPEESPEATTVEQVRRTYEVNVLGVVAVTGACLPLLRRATVGRVGRTGRGRAGATGAARPGRPHRHLPGQGRGLHRRNRA